MQLKENWGTDEAKKYSNHIADLETKITKTNMAEAIKAYKLLEEFYLSRQAPYDQKLILIDLFTNTRIQSLGTMFQPVRSLAEKTSKLKIYQAEMRDFGKFLKDRYFK